MRNLNFLVLVFAFCFVHLSMQQSNINETNTNTQTTQPHPQPQPQPEPQPEPEPEPETNINPSPTLPPVPFHENVMSLNFYETYDGGNDLPYMKFHFKTSDRCRIASDGYSSFGYHGLCLSDETASLKLFCDLNCENCEINANISFGDRFGSKSTKQKLGILPLTENGVGNSFILEGFCNLEFPTIPSPHQTVVSTNCSTNEQTALFEFLPSNCYTFRTPNNQKLQYLQLSCSNNSPQLRNCSTVTCGRCSSISSRSTSCQEEAVIGCGVAITFAPATTVPVVDTHTVLDWVGASIGSVIVVSIVLLSCFLYFRKKLMSSSEQEMAKYLRNTEDYDD